MGYRLNKSHEEFMRDAAKPGRLVKGSRKKGVKELKRLPPGRQTTKAPVDFALMDGETPKSWLFRSPTKQGREAFFEQEKRRIQTPLFTNRFGEWRFTSPSYLTSKDLTTLVALCGLAGVSGVSLSPEEMTKAMEDMGKPNRDGSRHADLPEVAYTDTAKFDREDVKWVRVTTTATDICRVLNIKPSAGQKKLIYKSLERLNDVTIKPYGWVGDAKAVVALGSGIPLIDFKLVYPEKHRKRLEALEWYKACVDFFDASQGKETNGPQEGTFSSIAREIHVYISPIIAQHLLNLPNETREDRKEKGFYARISLAELRRLKGELSRHVAIFLSAHISQGALFRMEAKELYERIYGKDDVERTTKAQRYGSLKAATSELNKLTTWTITNPAGRPGKKDPAWNDKTVIDIQRAGKMQAMGAEVGQLVRAEDLDLPENLIEPGRGVNTIGAVGRKRTQALKSLERQPREEAEA